MCRLQFCTLLGPENNWPHGQGCGHWEASAWPSKDPGPGWGFHLPGSKVVLFYHSQALVFTLFATAGYCRKCYIPSYSAPH